MDSWAFSKILEIASTSESAVFVVAVADLLVHTFFRIAFGVNVRPTVYRRLRVK